MKERTFVIALTVMVVAAASTWASGLIGIGEVKDYDVTAVLQGSRGTGFDYTSVSDKPTVGALHIASNGKGTFTGKLAMVMPVKMTAKGIEIDESVDPEILLFNKGHNISVTMEVGASATLHGKLLRAAQKTEFTLRDSDDSELERNIRYGILNVVSDAPSPGQLDSEHSLSPVPPTKWAGRSTTGKMWTYVEFHLDGKQENVGPFKIVLGAEEGDRPMWQAEILSTVPIREDGSFIIEPKADDSFSMQALAEVSFVNMTWGVPIRVVRGFLKPDGTVDGSIETRFEAIKLTDGTEAKPSLKWTATRIEVDSSAQRDIAVEAKGAGDTQTQQ